MPKHELTLRIEHAIPVGNVDLEIPVKVDGRPYGRLKISRGGVDWLPSPAQKASYALSWEQLAELMQAQGRKKN